MLADEQNISRYVAASDGPGEECATLAHLTPRTVMDRSDFSRLEGRAASPFEPEVL
jgi:hypothetical protein